jgi:hypothetical protein
MVDQAGTARKIDDDARQSFVKGHIGMAITTQPFFVAHGFGNGLAQGDANIFYGVVTVDVQIAFGIDFQIDEAVAGNLVQHVIKETNAGRQAGLAGAVQIHFDANLGFCSFARDFCNAG